MKRLIQKCSIQNKRRKLFTVLVIINLFVKSPKLNESPSDSLVNHNNLAFEIVNRPSRGGAVFEADAFNLWEIKNNRFSGTTNQFHPLNPFLPPRPGREIPSVTEVKPMTNRGLPPIRGKIKSQNEFLYRNRMPGNGIRNNPVKDCLPVPNVQALTLNVNNFEIELKMDLKKNPFESKKLKDFAPEVVFVLSKLKELAATKAQNIYNKNLLSNNVSSLIDSVKTKAMAPNTTDDDMVIYENLNIEDETIQAVYQKYRERLYKIIDCQGQVTLHEKLYNNELENIVEDYREELSNLIIFDSSDEPPIFLSKTEIDQLVEELRLKVKLDLPEAFLKCTRNSPSQADSEMPTLLNRPTHNIGYRDFTHDLEGNNYSIPVGRPVMKRSTVESLTTETLTVDKRVNGINYSFKIDYEAARNKFYHAQNFSVELPLTFNETEFKQIRAEKKLIPQRKYLARTVPLEAVNQFRLAIKKHLLNESTDLIIGTHRLSTKVPAYHLFNPETLNDCFFYIDEKTEVGNFVSGWTLDEDQVTNLQNTGNFKKKK